MKYMREDIRRIVEGREKSTHYYEDIFGKFVDFQIAIINNKRINIVAFEFTAEIILAVRKLRQFGKEPQCIIVNRFDENNAYYHVLKGMNLDCEFISFDKFREKYSYKDKSNDVFLTCYWYISICDFNTFLFKVKRRIASKTSKFVLQNPIDRRYTNQTIPFPFPVNSIDEADYAYLLYFTEHINELEETYDLLEDQESKDTLVEIIRTKCENDKYRYNEGLPENKYWECYKHLNNEKLVNCGSCYGDTICWFLYKEYEYDYIDAYEGDIKTYNTLKENVKRLGNKKINLFNQYIGINNDTQDNFDELYKNREVTLINMDIEGAETGVLNGARKVIKEQEPVLAICAYHKPSDIVEIPKIVHECSPNYHFYLRKYTSACDKGVAEYVYYMVPQNRIIKS